MAAGVVMLTFALGILLLCSTPSPAAPGHSPYFTQPVQEVFTEPAWELCHELRTVTGYSRDEGERVDALGLPLRPWANTCAIPRRGDYQLGDIFYIHVPTLYDRVWLQKAQRWETVIWYNGWDYLAVATDWVGVDDRIDVVTTCDDESKAITSACITARYTRFRLPLPKRVRK